MAFKYSLIVNGTDLTNMVERDSYETSIDPVIGAQVTTMDGVDHVAVLRYKGGIRVSLNPQTEDACATAISALMTQPMEVYYHCLQRNEDRYANMVLDSVSATFLSRCLHQGKKWVQLEDLIFTEL